jgi:uncharacterized protein YjbK
MSTNIEIEGKILVEENEFLKVMEFLELTEKDAVLQINHYIDTKNSQLRSFGFSLRVRERKGTYTLTLKSPMAEGTLEKDQQISQKQYILFRDSNKFPEGLVKDFLLMFGFPVEEVAIITSLSTWRIDSVFMEQNVCLDKNVYGENTDYEIESEQSSIQLAEETLKKLCEQTQIPFRPNQVSKHARALQSVGLQK